MFRRFKIGARLVTGFFVISLLMGVVCIFSYRGLAKLRAPLTEDIPAELADKAQEARHHQNEKEEPGTPHGTCQEEFRREDLPL